MTHRKSILRSGRITPTRRDVLGGVGLALLASWGRRAARAAAANWPTKPVKIVAAFAAGGTADLYARLMAAELSTSLHQQFYVENRAGSSGALGTAQVARAEPDGYTLLIGGAGALFTGPAVNPNIGYDTMRDFQHIGMIAGDGYIVAARPGSDIPSFAALREVARRRPVTCGSPGAGSLAHLIIERLNRASGIELQHVPYRSAGDSLTNLLGGHVDLGLQTFGSVGELVRTGQIVALAVADRTRAPGFPDVPSFGDLGYPDVGGVAWFWLAGPAGMPGEIVEILNHEVRRIIKTPEIARRLEQDAALTRDFDPPALTDFIASQARSWSELAREIGLRVQ